MGNLFLIGLLSLIASFGIKTDAGTVLFFLGVLLMVCALAGAAA